MYFVTIEVLPMLPSNLRVSVVVVPQYQPRTCQEDNAYARPKGEPIHARRQSHSPVPRRTTSRQVLLPPQFSVVATFGVRDRVQTWFSVAFSLYSPSPLYMSLHLL